MKSKPHQRSFAALAAAFLLAPAHGQIQLNYPLGESDPGAVAAAAGNATTVDTIGANDHCAHRHFVIHLLCPLRECKCMAHPVLVVWRGIVHPYSHSMVAGGLPEMS